MALSVRKLLEVRDDEPAIAPIALGVVAAACVSVIAVTAAVAICGLCSESKPPPKPARQANQPTPSQSTQYNGGPHQGPARGQGGQYSQPQPSGNPRPNHGATPAGRHHGQPSYGHAGAYTEAPQGPRHPGGHNDLRRPTGPPPDILMTEAPPTRPSGHASAPGHANASHAYADPHHRSTSSAGQSSYPETRKNGHAAGSYRGQPGYRQPIANEHQPRPGHGQQYDDRPINAQRQDDRRPGPAHDFGSRMRDDSAISGTPVPNEQQHADIMLNAATVDETVRLLHAVCDRMGGAIQAQFTLHKSSIRPGMNSAVAEVTTRFGTEVTVAFFPDKNRKAKQMKMYEKNTMKDFMPVVSDENGPIVYTENGVSVSLPAHIYVDRCTTLRDAMRQCSSARDTLHELFTICQNLTKQLQMQHRRSICLRDINARNIVRANVGTTRSWTLLEYCNAMRAGNRTDVLPAWCTPPELADARLRNEAVILSTSFDMWQLGTFVYEVATGKPYWPASMTDLSILNTLASSSLPLPHEERPVNTELVQRILSQLLTRSESHRLTAEALKKLLDKEEETGTLAATINAGKAMTEGPVVLAGV